MLHNMHVIQALSASQARQATLAAEGHISTTECRINTSTLEMRKQQEINYLLRSLAADVIYINRHGPTKP